jgi:hypothetical protein
MLSAELAVFTSSIVMSLLMIPPQDSFEFSDALSRSYFVKRVE